MSDELIQALETYPVKANTKAEQYIIQMLTTTDPVDINQILAEMAQEVEDAKNSRPPMPQRPS